MPIPEARRKEIIANYRINPTDTGSSEVQVALLTDLIISMTAHLKIHPKDLHSRLGLNKMVANRNSLLMYLRNNNFDRYKTLIERLGLRK